MMQWRENLPEECRQCAFSDQCAGGCRAEGLLQGKLCDPLINSHRITRAASIHKSVLRLYTKQRYTTKCLRRKERFGEMLFYEGEVALVCHDAAAMMDDLAAGKTTQEIGHRYGPLGLEVLAELLLCGFIQYRDSPSPTVRHSARPKISAVMA
jgi:hypothetical protein